MVIEKLNSWLPASVESDVADLCAQLRSFNGHRTVWVDREGTLWHAEPDEMLEELGHRYVGTFFHPATGDVCDALAKAVPWLRASMPSRASDVMPAGAAFAHA